MISRSAAVRLRSVKSRETRCRSESRASRCPSTLSSLDIEVSMTSFLAAYTTSSKRGRWPPNRAQGASAARGAPRRRMRAEGAEAPLDGHAFAIARLEPGGIGLGLRRQVAERREDALELERLRVVGPERRERLVEPAAEGARVGARRDGQERVAVADEERTLPELERELLVLEDPAVLVAEDRQQDLVLQLRLERVPVDVEGPRGGRRGAALEDVPPPRVAVPGDPHVGRHPVQDLAHPAGAQGVGGGRGGR